MQPPEAGPVDPTPNPPAPPRRWRVGIADLMIASVAVALTLNVTVSERTALVNTLGYAFGETLWSVIWNGNNNFVWILNRGQNSSIVSMLVMFGIGTLMAMPPALLLLAYRHRDQPVRRIWLRPGYLASLVGVAGLAETIYLGANRYLFAQAIIPAWIAAGWAALALTGRWKPSRVGLERAGRWVGWAWLVVGALLLFALLRIYLRGQVLIWYR